MSRTRSDVLQLPVLPLRDVVVFPHMVISLFVGRDKSMRALEQAMEADKQILLLAQKSAETDDPDAGDLYTVGTLAQVLQLPAANPETTVADALAQWVEIWRSTYNAQRD